MANDNRPDEYIIPQNITDNGNVISFVKKRNFAEVCVVLGTGFVISFGICSFLSLLVRCAIFFPFLLLALVTLVGFRGEPLFEYFIAFVICKRKARMMRYKLPRPETEETSRKRKKKEED